MNALTEFKSYSQAGQDEWVLSKFPKGYKGTFLDIGCSHPVELSNTYALEQLGWLGLLVDIDDVTELVENHRVSPFKMLDATSYDFSGLLKHFDLEPLVDYVSLDVDSATLDAVRNLLSNGIAFKVATVEHDRYRFGDERAKDIRRFLTKAGYTIERLDVSHQGLPFEDWWVR